MTKISNFYIINLNSCNNDPLISDNNIQRNLVLIHTIMCITRVIHYYSAHDFPRKKISA